MVENNQAKIVEDKVATTQAVSDDNQPQAVEEIAQDRGINMELEEPVQTKQELEERDRQRWELNPDSRNKQ